MLHVPMCNSFVTHLCTHRPVVYQLLAVAITEMKHRIANIPVGKQMNYMCKTHENNAHQTYSTPSTPNPLPYIILHNNNI